MRKVVEIQQMGKPSGRDRVQWRVIETRVKGTAAVQVSELPLKVPRYSFRVGSAQLDENTNEMRIGPRLTVFNVQDAVELLEELGKKYVEARESKIEELERKKDAWQSRNPQGSDPAVDTEGSLGVEPDYEDDDV